ncbi:hypothetical protein KR100_01365 [Synechococcus sp. KORDI-100]|uniref:phytanoyl-CoA dioxygenase family protein n=1 Tax=Synechococcus sp. KORDI-100 TaxID=1280380 RepID=UPI0004E0A9D9|nr:phytanoyl-CoA dioxygenase family protein [Synechococcus sp. KORDI-100]AII42055.1 hypothetical protein KR100_01365 [Synechococcus sp. KORDI-100]
MENTKLTKRLKELGISDLEFNIYKKEYYENFKNNKTTEQVHLQLLKRYCESGGEVQEILHRLFHGNRLNIVNQISLKSKRWSLTSEEFTSTIHQIVDEGYALFPRRLTSATIKELNDFANQCKHTFMIKNKANQEIVYKEGYLYETPEGTITAEADLKSVETHNPVQDLISDSVLKSIVSMSLGAPVKATRISLWNTYQSTEEEGEAAQKFHFDLDGLRWLKIFIFLTSVGPNNGPHMYIPRSHWPSSKHLMEQIMTSKGYSRYDDSEIEKFYAREDWKTLICNQGEIVIADTRCWHKGTRVKNGFRRVLQPLYTANTFCQNLTTA